MLIALVINKNLNTVMKALIYILTLFVGKINGGLSTTRSADGRKQNGSSPVMMFPLILVHSPFAT